MVTLLLFCCSPAFSLKEEPPHIVIGTPGRIFDLVEQKALDLSKIKHFVLDECDAVLSALDMRKVVQDIFKTTPYEKQVMMFTATIPDDLKTVCKKFMNSVRLGNAVNCDGDDDDFDDDDDDSGDSGVNARNCRSLLLQRRGGGCDETTFYGKPIDV